MAMSFYHAFDFPVTIARAFNTYGPRESARDIVPTLITQIVAGHKTIKVGDLTPTRDMNYVKDICRGMVLLAEHDTTIGKEINICSNSEISMHELLNKIKRIMHNDAGIESEPQRMRPAGSEVYRLVGDNSLLKELTGFKPDFTIDEGLKITCEWFLKKENSMRYKANIYNV
jgi:nucleoside-diphosphate-sugar epimerase